MVMVIWWWCDNVMVWWCDGGGCVCVGEDRPESVSGSDAKAVSPVQSRPEETPHSLQRQDSDRTGSPGYTAGGNLQTGVFQDSPPQRTYHIMGYFWGVYISQISWNENFHEDYTREITMLGTCVWFSINFTMLGTCVWFSINFTMLGTCVWFSINFAKINSVNWRNFEISKFAKYTLYTPRNITRYTVYLSVVITRAACLWPILLVAYFNNTYLTDNDFTGTNDSTHNDTYMYMYIDNKECNN